jgi:hypothetical protein
VETHRGAAPSLRRFGAPKEVGCQNGVSISEDISPDLDRLAGNPFDRIPASFHQRIDVLDPDALTGEVAD